MTLRTFSFGGGVQSTACLVLAAQGEIDYRTFLFCNVGDDSEYPGTLRYVEQITKPYAAAHGIELHELAREVSRGPNKGHETLYGRLTRPGSRSIPIPVRMSDTGAPGTRSCTADFKIRLVAAWLRQHGATPEAPALTGLGISVDEVHRARTDSGIAWQHLAYPLLDLGLRRTDCLKVIADAGLPEPPRSACWFCPFHRRDEWQRMKRDEPELFERAADLEDLLNARRAALGRDPVYLTDFKAPLRQVFANDQLVLFAGTNGTDLGTCESGYCMT